MFKIVDAALQMCGLVRINKVREDVGERMKKALGIRIRKVTIPHLHREIKSEKARKRQGHVRCPIPNGSYIGIAEYFELLGYETEKQTSGNSELIVIYWDRKASESKSPIQK